MQCADESLKKKCETKEKRPLESSERGGKKRPERSVTSVSFRLYEFCAGGKFKRNNSIT